jgi:hypothetical protein
MAFENGGRQVQSPFLIGLRPSMQTRQAHIVDEQCKAALGCRKAPPVFFIYAGNGQKQESMLCMLLGSKKQQ